MLAGGDKDRALVDCTDLIANRARRLVKVLRNAGSPSASSRLRFTVRDDVFPDESGGGIRSRRLSSILRNQGRCAPAFSSPWERQLPEATTPCSLLRYPG